MLLLAIYRPTARICTEDDLLKLDFGLQMFQKMEVTASNWKYEFQPTAKTGRDMLEATTTLKIKQVIRDNNLFKLGLLSCEKHLIILCILNFKVCNGITSPFHNVAQYYYMT